MRPKGTAMNNRTGKASHVSRAEFLKGGIALALTIPWIGIQARQVDAAGDPAPAAQEIAPGVFVHHGVHEMASAANRGDICNTSFVIGTSSVAVIDTGGCAKVGAGLRAAIAGKTSLPLSHVITTHMHPDHVLGNAAF